MFRRISGKIILKILRRLPEGHADISDQIAEDTELARDPGGGGTPLYGLYRYVRPRRVWFFSRFGHK